MMSRPGELVRKARVIQRSEGFTHLLGYSLNYATPPWLFRYTNWYLYEFEHREMNEADFIPQIQDFTFRIVHSNEEADELAASVGSDFRRSAANIRKRLDRGALAFCIFIGSVIAYIGWVALSEKAKKAIDSLPHKVDFSNKEAYISGVKTTPEYRQKGLMTYGYFKKFQFLSETGIGKCRCAVPLHNIASQKAHARFEPRTYAQARYIKFLCFKFWKEKPLNLEHSC